MKKIIAAALALLVMGSTAFALDMAIGAGVLGGFDFDHGDGEGTDYEEVFDMYTSTYVDVPYTYTYTYDNVGSKLGGFIFLGVSQYLELNLAFMNTGFKTTYTYSDIGAADPVTVASFTLAFGVYFKYPFPVSDRLVIFPTVGADYEIYINDDPDVDFANDLWARAGVGLDVFLTEKLFLRTHAIYGLRFETRIGAEELAMGHGPLFKIGLGWMF